MRSIYGNTTIEYSLHAQNRKDLRIVVGIVNGVVIYAPYGAKEEQIHNILSDKAKWIYGKVQALIKVKVDVTLKEFVSGEKLPYLGRHYRLKVHHEALEDITIKFQQGKFIATVPKYWEQKLVQVALERDLIAWYRKHGLRKIQERASYFKHLLGVEAKSIQLRTQYKRLGTCTPEGKIYLNWRIVMAPVRVIDYIIVHELAHIRIPEYNQHFWKLVKSILPNYQ